MRRSTASKHAPETPTTTTIATTSSLVSRDLSNFRSRGPADDVVSGSRNVVGSVVRRALLSVVFISGSGVDLSSTVEELLGAVVIRMMEVVVSGSGIMG